MDELPLELPLAKMDSMTTMPSGPLNVAGPVEDSLLHVQTSKMYRKGHLVREQYSSPA